MPFWKGVYICEWPQGLRSLGQSGSICSSREVRGHCELASSTLFPQPLLPWSVFGKCKDFGCFVLFCICLWWKRLLRAARYNIIWITVWNRDEKVFVSRKGNQLSARGLIVIICSYFLPHMPNSCWDTSLVVLWRVYGNGQDFVFWAVLMGSFTQLCAFERERECRQICSIH